MVQLLVLHGACIARGVTFRGNFTKHKKLHKNPKIHFHVDRKQSEAFQTLSALKTREIHNFMAVLLLNSTWALRTPSSPREQSQHGRPIPQGARSRWVYLQMCKLLFGGSTFELTFASVPISHPRLGGPALYAVRQDHLALLPDGSWIGIASREEGGKRRRKEGEERGFLHKLREHLRLLFGRKLSVQ